MIYIADSSFLVSLALAEDENHKKAVAELKKIKDGKILICNPVLHETLTVLLYKRNSFFARGFYQAISMTEGIIFKFIPIEEENEILNDFLSQESRLSFVDVCVKDIAEKAGYDVLAFDRDLMKAVKS